MRKISLLFGLVLALGLATTASAQQPNQCHVDFQPLNSSGVSGTATLQLTGNQLTVSIQARGLAPSQTHPQHIHGFPDASRNATCPTMALDTDGNGIVSLEEGMPAYGPVLVPLEPFPMAPDGTIDYQQTLTVDPNQLMPLQNRVIVLHGRAVGGQYMATVPVACGQIEMGVGAMPRTGGGRAAGPDLAPALLGLALLGLGGLGALTVLGRVRRERGA